jgi:hypothetical protein
LPTTVGAFSGSSLIFKRPRYCEIDDEGLGGHVGTQSVRDSLKGAWLTVAFVCVIDSIWAWRVGFRVEGFPKAILIVSILLAIGFFYQYNNRNPHLRDLGHYLALWLVFPVALNIYSYLAATPHLPLCDAQLCALDESMGFHWMRWATLLHPHRTAKIGLLLAYDSIVFQGFTSIAFFALTGNNQRNRELLWITMLAGIATVAISGFAPALGPMTADHPPAWTQVLLKIRDGSMRSTPLWNMNGIVAFPSFHTVLGVAFVYVHRPPSRTFIPVAMINALMFVSIPFMGHHYLVDVIAGTAITMIAIIAYRVATAPARERLVVDVPVAATALRRAQRS